MILLAVVCIAPLLLGGHYGMHKLLNGTYIN